MEINKDNKKNNINNKNKITDKNENIILDKMNENEDLIWTEKYRPKSVDEYLNISKYKSTINNWITPIINSEKVRAYHQLTKLLPRILRMEDLGNSFPVSTSS